MDLMRCLFALLFAAIVSAGSPALAQQAAPLSIDQERCVAFAAFAKAKFAKPDGVVTDWAMDFQDHRLDSCDWKPLGVAFPKRYDPDWKPSRCLVESLKVEPSGKATPVCLEPEFQAFISIERAAIDIERTPRRCNNSPVGWCSDAKYSASIQVVWAALSLSGGTELCELDRVNDNWVFKGCHANGPVS
jgi:hypothetical protein